MSFEPSRNDISRSAARALREVFGYETFRPNQQDIIERVLDGRDVVAIMPTGGGKSLCYQLPALLLPGTAVVVSPLISLMKDQVDAALASGIRAACLNSSLDAGEASAVHRDFRAGLLDLLYVAPERFAVAGFAEALKAARISLFAVDEAHCISQWGHDFRPDYRNLSRLREEFPDVPVAAFTASATERVQADLVGCLALRDPYVVRASFDRPNLTYEVRRRENTERQLLDFLRGTVDESGIIYCATRREVDRLAERLRRNGIDALPYHAGLPPEQRAENQERFDRDQVRVMVATVAFGMGIDKPSVRFVIHTSLPRDMESYYQETGRAGRDGDPAVCLLLRGSSEIPLLRRFAEDAPDEILRRSALQRLQAMIRYAGSLACRRKQILRYFGEEYPAENCGSCDVCLGVHETVDITVDAQKLMSAVYRTGQRFGAGHVVDVVIGSDTRKVRQYGHHEVKTFGVGREHGKSYWRAVVDELISQECLVPNGERYPVLSLTPTGLEVLTGKRSLAASRAILERQDVRTGREKVDVTPADPVLFEALKRLRREIAAERSVPPYVIASDRTLREICALKPETDEELGMVHGIGRKKLQDIGQRFLHAIREYRESGPEFSRESP